MSRSPRVTRHPSRRGSRTHLILPGWLAACTLPSVGCFYIEPIVDINVPPVILSPEGSEEEIPFLLNQSTTLLVVASDPDSQEVACFWTIQGRDSPDSTCDHQGELVFTVLNLGYDPTLDDKLVTAHLYDNDSNQDVTVRFRILVDVPEGS
jgi:hypothetical protein